MLDGQLSFIYDESQIYTRVMGKHPFVYTRGRPVADNIYVVTGVDIPFERDFDILSIMVHNIRRVRIVPYFIPCKLRVADFPGMEELEEEEEEIVEFKDVIFNDDMPDFLYLDDCSEDDYGEPVAEYHDREFIPEFVHEQPISSPLSEVDFSEVTTGVKNMSTDWFTELDYPSDELVQFGLEYEPPAPITFPLPLFRGERPILTAQYSTEIYDRHVTNRVPQPEDLPAERYVSEDEDSPDEFGVDDNILDDSHDMIITTRLLTHYHMCVSCNTIYAHIHILDGRVHERKCAPCIRNPHIIRELVGADSPVAFDSEDDLVSNDEENEQDRYTWEGGSDEDEEDMLQDTIGEISGRELRTITQHLDLDLAKEVVRRALLYAGEISARDMMDGTIRRYAALILFGSWTIVFRELGLLERVNIRRFKFSWENENFTGFVDIDRPINNISVDLSNRAIYRGMRRRRQGHQEPSFPVYVDANGYAIVPFGVIELSHAAFLIINGNRVRVRIRRRLRKGWIVEVPQEITRGTYPFEEGELQGQLVIETPFRTFNYDMNGRELLFGDHNMYGGIVIVNSRCIGVVSSRDIFLEVILWEDIGP